MSHSRNARNRLAPSRMRRPWFAQTLLLAMVRSAEYDIVDVIEELERRDREQAEARRSIDAARARYDAHLTKRRDRFLAEPRATAAAATNAERAALQRLETSKGF